MDSFILPSPHGALIGSGQVGMTPTLGSPAGLDTSRSVVVDTTDGSTHEGFHFCRVSFGEPGTGWEHAPASDATTAVEPLLELRSGILAGAGLPPQHVDSVPDVPLASRASLDMRYSTLRAGFSVARPPSPHPVGVILHRVRVLQHLPAFTLHSLRVTVLNDQARELVHTVRAPLAAAVYRGEVLPVPRTPSMAYVVRGSSGGVQAACCYLPGPGMLVRGHEEPCDSPGTAHVRLALVEGPGEYTLHILTGHAVARTWEPLRQALLGQLCRAGAMGGAHPATITARLLAQHVLAWDARWATDVCLRGGGGAEDARLARSVRFAMYMLHASTSPASGQLLLLGRGQDLLLGQGPLLLQALLLLEPAVARRLVQRHADGLAAARERAQGHGWPAGAQLPLLPWGGEEQGMGRAPGDTEGMRLARAPFVLAESAVVARAAWDAFRVAPDQGWLQGVAWPVLAGVADLLSSAVQRCHGELEAQLVLGPAAGHGWRGDPRPDHGLTVAAGALALRGAVEAALYLGLRPRDAWVEALDGLRPPFYELPPLGEGTSPVSPAFGSPFPRPPARPELAGVLRRDGADDGDDGVSDGPLESVMAATPSFSAGAWGTQGAPFLGGQPALDCAALGRMVAHWEPRGDASNPVNALLLAFAEAMAAQLGAGVAGAEAGASAERCRGRLLRFLAAHEDPCGNLLSQPACPACNDLGLSAALLLVLVQGFGGARAVGEVGAGRMVVTGFGVSGAYDAALPATWERLEAAGLAGGNQLSLGGQAPSGPGGGGGGVSRLAPFSASSLSFV